MTVNQRRSFNAKAVLASILFAGSIWLSNAPIASADEYWNTNGTSATWTAVNWGTVSGGPYTNAWVNNSNAIFEANSSITNVTNTPIGNISVTNGSTVNLTAAGTYSTGAAVRTFDVGAGSILDFAAQNISTVAGTGLIKNGTGIYYSGNGNGFTGGFTLNNGTIVLGGINAMGAGALTINGGTIAASATRNITARYSSVTIGGDFTLGAVTTGVASGNGSASANITFADNMSLGAATRAITIGSNGTYTLGGILSGTAAGAGLTVNAASGATGQLVLTNTNTYTGKTTLNSGILSINLDTKLGTAPVSAVSDQLTFNGGTLRTTNTALATLAANRGVTVNSGGATFDLLGNGTSAGTLQILGTVTGSGNITKTGIANSVNTSVLELSANNSATFNGKYIINAGEVLADADANFGAVPGSPTADYFTLNGGFLRSNGPAITINSNRGITLGANGGGFDTATATSHSLEYDGVIAGGAGTGDLVKNGGQTLVLGGTNTYAGATDVNAGTLSVSSIANNLGTNSTVNLGSAATGGNLTYTGTGSDETTSKVINLAGTTGNAFLIQAGTNNLKFTSDFTATGAGSKTFTLQGSNTGTGEIAGAIVDNSGTNTTAVTKAGTGTWILSGASTYSGGTTVTNGTLLANNTAPLSSATGTGAITVNGGTFGGNGAVTGAVTANTGSFVSPGTPGTPVTIIAALTTGALTLQSGSTFVYDMNTDASLSAAADLLNAKGTNSLTISGATLSINDAGSTALTPGTKFTLISYNGASPGAFNTYPNLSNITVGANTYVLNYNDTSAGSNFDVGSNTSFVTITVTAVPEAGSIFLGAVVCLAVGGVVVGKRYFGRQAVEA